MNDCIYINRGILRFMQDDPQLFKVLLCCLLTAGKDGTFFSSLVEISFYTGLSTSVVYDKLILLMEKNLLYFGEDIKQERVLFTLKNYESFCKLGE